MKAFFFLFSFGISDRLLEKNNAIYSLHYVSIQLKTRSGPIGVMLEMELVAITKL